MHRLVKHSFSIALVFIISLALGELATRVAAILFPGVRYLATIGKGEEKREYDTLEEFASDQPHLIPHRNWHNYYNNAFGFNDVEFIELKPEGNFRIISLGDSFCYSMVPYPANVLTLVERYLDLQFPGTIIELLNCSAAATGVYEYNQVFKLTIDRYKPDMALLHFYMGNDGPDLYKHINEIPKVDQDWIFSYFLNYVKNAMRILLHVELKNGNHVKNVKNDTNNKDAPIKFGGALVDKNSDASEWLYQSAYSEEAFIKVMAAETGRFYNTGPDAVAHDFAPILDEIESIRSAAAKFNIPLVLIGYPSVLQIYPAFRNDIIDKIKRLPEYSEMDFEKIDTDLPNRVLKEYCERNGLPFIDLTKGFTAVAATNSHLFYMQRDTHWNIEGNALAARIESEALAKLLELYLSR